MLCSGFRWGPGAEREVWDKRPGCTPHPQPTTQSKEFTTFSASLTSAVLPSLPTHASPLDLSKQTRSLLLRAPVALRMYQRCHPGLIPSEATATCASASSAVFKAGTVLVHLCITHGIWNCALGIRGDQKILAGLHFIANYISKEGR